MDMVTVVGLIVGFMGIVGGMVLEGGHLSAIVQPTAAVIVFAGTIGAVLVSTTKRDLSTGLALLRLAFAGNQNEMLNRTMQDLLGAARLARQDSILALENRIDSFQHPFMKSVFKFVVDGVDGEVLRNVFETKIQLEEENQLAGAKIYADAGGYSPTIGIIGAVLGLIHVMSNLTDTSKLGSGIAVAFVATIYGVSSANLVFLPLASKIKRKVREESAVKEMILEGAVGIVNGLSPLVIQEKLHAFADELGPHLSGSINEAA